MASASGIFFSRSELTLKIPAEYLRDNWPVRVVSTSDDGKHIAVAARQSFIVYNNVYKRWMKLPESRVGDSLKESHLIS